MGWFNKITGIVSGAPIPFPAKLAALALDFGVRVASDAIQNRPLTGKRLLNQGLQTLGVHSRNRALNSGGVSTLKSLFGMGQGGIPNPKPSIPPANTKRIPLPMPPQIQST
jgi:hypothetical protein